MQKNNLILFAGSEDSKYQVILPIYLKKYKHNVDYMPSTFENVDLKINVDKHTEGMTFWGLLGMQDFLRLRQQSYENVNMVLLCFNPTQTSQIAEIKSKWLPEAKQYCLLKPKIILVGIIEGIGQAKHENQCLIDSMKEEYKQIDLCDGKTVTTFIEELTKYFIKQKQATKRKSTGSLIACIGINN